MIPSLRYRGACTPAAPERVLVIPPPSPRVPPALADSAAYTEGGQSGLIHARHEIPSCICDSCCPVRASRRQKPHPQIVIHPVSTSVPSAAWQRNRKGLSGMGSTEKQPISSTSVVLTPPALV